MMEDCPACDQGTCDYQEPNGRTDLVAECDTCHATFEVEPDADFDFESGWHDCSTLGRRLS